MSRAPLSGIRVVEMGWYVAGPWLGLQLARQGAEVIKVETNKRIDVMRQVPIIDQRPTGADYASFGGGKLSITLDVRTDRGRQLMYELLRKSDVLVENFSIEAIRRFGLEWPIVHACNPKLIMVRMPGLGLEGPRSAWLSYGLAMSALSGLDHITGFPDGPPGGSSISYPDYVAALHGLFGAMAALDYRARTGRGQLVEVAQFESAVSVLGSTLLEFEVNHQVRSRIGNRQPGCAPHGVYPCIGDDRWIALSVTSDDAWRRLADLAGPAVDRPQYGTLAGRLHHEDDLDAAVGAWTGQHEAEALVAALVQRGIGASVVATSADVLSDPQLLHRRFFKDLEVGEFGRLPFARSPISLDGETGEPARAHALGEDNERVFLDLLGLDADDYGQLIAEGVIG